MRKERVVIVGAGQAGAQAAISLRQSGFDGEILIIGAELAPPYQRPPLSKAYLKGELDSERLYLRPPVFYDSVNIELRLGETVAKIDRNKKRVITQSAEAIEYDRLLLTTGAPPRRLPVPGGGLEGVCYLRSLADSERLRSALGAGQRIVIVGAGYIGLEVAAVARQAGFAVTVLEMADRVLARVASRPVSAFFEKLHRDAGAALRFSSGVVAFNGDGAVTSVALASGDVVDCAAALVGVGAVPDVTLAEEARLEVGDGVIVDEYARTSDEHIWAAGDCANFPSPRYGRRIRLESVPNAIEQAKAAAANMLGRNVVYDTLPWFWSDQHDVKLQSVGLGEDADETILRGDPDSENFSVWRLQNGRPIAVETINDPAAFAIGKQMIAAGLTVDRARLADSAADLMSMISR